MTRDPDKQRLAVMLLKRRIHMLPALLREPHRDVAGQLLADVVASARLIRFIAGGRWSETTEIELRAVRNSRRRLMERVR